MKIMVERDNNIILHIEESGVEVGSILYNKNGALLFAGNMESSTKILFSSILRKLTNLRIYLVIGVNFLDHASWIHGAFVNEVEADDRAEELQDLADTFPVQLRTADPLSSSKIRDYPSSEIEYFVTSTPLNILST